MKSNEEWSSQLWSQFLQLRNEAWKKFRTSTGLEPVTSRIPVRRSTNWAMKPLTLGAGQFLKDKAFAHLTTLWFGCSNALRRTLKETIMPIIRAHILPGAHVMSDLTLFWHSENDKFDSITCFILYLGRYLQQWRLLYLIWKCIKWAFWKKNTSYHVSPENFRKTLWESLN